ncbi:hypothetical protein FXO37_10701 [Capsicum annuum]|nr:hypothetical protein FXO37_10701 [Capsicum annuum]
MILLFLILASFMQLCFGVVYKVGDSAGWTTIGNVDYKQWAANKTFSVGDVIVENLSEIIFLPASDTPGVALILIKLTGPENYGIWSRSMRLALLVKNKLGFVDGTCAKSSYKGNLAIRWERCDAVVLSWISAAVAPELMTSIVYASCSKKVLKMMVPKPTAHCETNAAAGMHVCDNASGNAALSTGEVIGIGKEEDGLYILRHKTLSVAGNVVQGKSFTEQRLWHLRLGNPSMQVLKHISFLKNQVDINVPKDYNGTEFFNSHMNKSIIFFWYYTSKQLPVERKHKHLLDMGRALELQSHVPSRFWGDCVETAAYLINRLPTAVLNEKSPYELLFGHTPRLDHLKVFGCLCFASVLPRGDKFEARARKAVLLGFSTTQKGYKLYDLDNKSFVVSRDQPVLQPSDIHSTGPVSPSLHDGALEPDSLAEEKPHGNDSHEEHVETDVPSVEGPSVLLYDEAILVPSIHADSVEIQQITGSVWKTHRTSKPPIWIKDYVVPKKSSPHSITNHVCYDNITTGDLREDIYMDLFLSFQQAGTSNSKVCKLRKSLYGLKQASRQWNIKLTEAGYSQSAHDHSLFIKKEGADLAAILVYVDDLLITGNSSQLI